LLGYGSERTEFGLKSSKKVNKNSIELHVSVDKVIDWSTGREYKLPEDVFAKADNVGVKASLEENVGLEVSIKVAPVEDVVIMKLMTERPRDHFDAIAVILDSFDDLDMLRFKENSNQDDLSRHICNRLESVLADLRRGLVKELWREYTGREFIRQQRVDLRVKINKLIEALRIF